MYPQHKYLLFLELSVRVPAEDGGQSLLLGFLRLLCLHQSVQIFLAYAGHSHRFLKETEIVLRRLKHLLSSELLVKA